ncbi:MAG: rhomboid family intramembrane serine protease [Anaerolinea sp.]|nr:rhomboid family intramembrane serine protease [Anaerolinea sp.]
MLNEQPPEVQPPDVKSERRVHPLEREAPPSKMPGSGEEPPRRQVTLHIPSVRPLVTYSLLAVMIAIFVLRAVSPTLDIALLDWGANQRDLVLGQGEIHRLFTSIFLHASIYGAYGQFALQNSLHLIFNAYIIWAAGATIERLFGHVRYALVFILGGLAGSVLSAVLGEGTYSVGASGAVFAILGAEFVYLYQHRKLLGTGGRRQMMGLVQLAVINLLFGLLTNATDAAIRIDNWAHIGGALGGLALGFAIGPIFIVSKHPTIAGHLLAEDINPLRRRWWTLSIYSIVVMVILILARASYFPYVNGA